MKNADMTSSQNKKIILYQIRISRVHLNKI